MTTPQVVPHTAPVKGAKKNRFADAPFSKEGILSAGSLVTSVCGAEDHIVMLTVDVYNNPKAFKSFVAAVAASGRWNGFNGAALAQTLKGLFKRGLLQQVAFGREYSPVLYIWNPYRANVKNPLRKVKQALKSGKHVPDELFVYENPKHPKESRLRAWWD